MNTNVLKTSKSYNNKLVSVTTSNNLKIFLRLLLFLFLKDSTTTVLYIPWNQHQSRNHTEPQLVPKFLLHVSVRELHNNLSSATIYGGLKEARDEDDNIIISDSTLRSLLPPQFKKFHQYARLYVVGNVEATSSN